MVHVRLSKVWLPEIVVVWVVLNITVLEPSLKLLTFQFPPMVIFWVPVAVSVDVLTRVMLPPTVRALVPRFNVPLAELAIVRFPLT